YEPTSISASSNSPAASSAYVDSEPHSETISKSVAEAWGLRLPDTDWDAVERFIRHTPHGAWVKGQHCEAFRVQSVEQALAARRFVEREWGGRWRLEAHVTGQECGIAFVARSGVLLDAVLMTKAILTPEGKTLSGEIAEQPQQSWERLRVYTADV
ncbi:hypothetical protein, partial [Streptomyces zaomyceticus]|uniref:hypothetical protein n=1 Tax=Streptomyces zaomyceticus TaxID=68286 RepID=UPI00369355D0